MGYIPAQATAKTVIASAKRLIELRQLWRRRRRMAEISVPAWPMPIHQTKQMMSQPQPTGTLLPQTPMPVMKRFVTAKRKTFSSANPMPKPASHHFGVFTSFSVTASAIRSVTVAGVWPGARTGAWAIGSGPWAASYVVDIRRPPGPGSG
jgi:hypothetical protein